MFSFLFLCVFFLEADQPDKLLKTPTKQTIFVYETKCCGLTNLNKCKEKRHLQRESSVSADTEAEA